MDHTFFQIVKTRG